ncbi:type IV pilus modification protein PilV [Dyella telluris]|uniref:Type IV pilus modification protein PilV n=1 Tax=Dyella telluris TaxID=2763498 RepID=A0A7G8Q631_9GAMM|nr:type IV pilus modification protein PilV [Dyella telluris]QNK02239.1 type IV pilus modification protein PilV [Dyella telluris]
MTTRVSNQHRARCRAAVRAQRGVGLIEVLVAVLLLSIAFLGVAALQATSLSTNNSAMARSMATVASYSVLDAMRADRTVAMAGGYNTSGAIKASACPAEGSTLASVQLHDWCNTLGATLGAVESTTGQIACQGAEGDCTITIQFDDSRAGTGGANNQSVVTRGML